MSIYFNEFKMIELKGTDLQDNTTVNGYTKHVRGLSGKVVVLIANDAFSVQHLILQLARRGADIALVSLQASYRTARLLKEEVRNEGRRFLYVQTSLDEENSAEDTMQKIVSHFKHIDVFIDLSADRRKAPNEESKLSAATFLTNWNLAEAAIRQIVR